MRLILLGAPGAGKGTQAAALTEHLGVQHISSGDLLRSDVAARTALGREVAAFLDRGELAPDDLVTRVVTDVLATAGPGYVLEGYPRTLSQARRADAVAGDGLVDAVVFLDLSDDVARQRLAERNVGRSDDRDPEVIERRLRRFHTDTEPVVDYYRDRGLLVIVDAAQAPDVVTTETLAALSGSHRP